MQTCTQVYYAKTQRARPVSPKGIININRPVVRIFVLHHPPSQLQSSRAHEFKNSLSPNLPGAHQGKRWRGASTGYPRHATYVIASLKLAVSLFV